MLQARTGVATETGKQPGTSDMRIKAIEEAMRHFQMIWEKRTTGWNLTENMIRFEERNKMIIQDFEPKHIEECMFRSRNLKVPITA